MKKLGRAGMAALLVSIVFSSAAFPGGSHASGENKAIKELREEMRFLREEMAAQQKRYEARIEELQKDINAMSEQNAADSGKAEAGEVDAILWGESSSWKAETVGRR